MRITRYMRGEIQWDSVPWLAWHYGCDDFDTLIELMPIVADHMNKPPPEI